VCNREPLASCTDGRASGPRSPGQSPAEPAVRLNSKVRQWGHGERRRSAHGHVPGGWALAFATLRAVPEPEQSFVDRLSRQGEEALGRIAEELIANPVVNGALTRAFDAREKAVQAQEAAMGALNIPSAADIERITRRLRSVSQRLEGIEDALDRVEERLGMAAAGEDRAAALEGRLEEVGRDVAALREAVAPSDEPVPRAQERLTVTDS
jgi:hypothetical protein